LVLYQLTTAVGFIWSDNSPLNFVNWAKREPNNAGNGENCADMIASTSMLNRVT
jgi:hypothetical protein